MKQRLFFLSLLSMFFSLATAQVPQGFNYQAIARDGGGAILPNTPLQVMIYIQSAPTGGTIFWKELHSSVTTNAFGLFNIVVGTGTRQGESDVAAFDLIDWSIAPKYIKTDIYYSGSWKYLAATQLLTVPYAMTARNLTGTAKLGIQGTTSNNEEALFEVRNKDGQTIFAVYNEGVRIWVDDGAKGLKGGFAVGGFDMTKLTRKEYMVVSDDSVRIYIDNDTLTKKLKGGFAVGGYDISKSDVQEYLRVTNDSTRIYVNSASSKALKGGFAVGGFDNTKGGDVPFLSLKPENYFIGHEAGASNTTGLYNSFFGYKAGKSNTEGFQNIFIGHLTGINNTTGDGNLFIGDSAGFSNTSGNINVLLGGFAGSSNTTGYQNINIGYCAGLKNLTGNRNIAIGTAAAQDNTTGFLNVSIGNFAGALSLGNNNTYIGSRAGLNNVNGSRNVFIGFEAGRDETNSNRLYIANTYLGDPLIYGEFDNGRVVINGNSTQNTSERTLFVNGSAGGLESWYNDSDRNLKHDIVTIPDALEKVMKIRGVNFMWNNPKEGMDRLQMGFIGQETAEVVPEVVSVKDNRYTMQYAPLTALLVEAVKEQQNLIEAQQKEIEELKGIINEIKSEMESSSHEE